MYLSMPQGELSTKLIVYNAFRQGKAVYIPYLYTSPSAESEGPKSLMDMVSLDSEADYEALEPDAWGIPTPSQDSVVERKRCLGTGQGERCDSNELDLIIMPGVAFDHAIARLGHGKGFYDFFLQRYKQQHTSKAGSSTKMPFLGKSSTLPLVHRRGLDRCCIVGLALEEQLLPEDDRIPMDATDWRLEALVVGNGTVLRR